MHSTTHTRVSILPVLDYGPPAGGSAPDGNVGAPFDALLHPPPPVCPPPPKTDKAADEPGNVHSRRASRDDAAAAEQSHLRGPVEQANNSQANKQPQSTTAEVAEDSAEAAGGETT